MWFAYDTEVGAPSAEGLLHFMAPLHGPHYQQLLSPELWAKVGERLFLGLSIGSGVLQSAASFNNVEEPIFIWSWSFGILDTLLTMGSSMFGYALLGVSAKRLGSTVAEEAYDKNFALVSTRRLLRAGSDTIKEAF